MNVLSKVFPIRSCTYFIDKSVIEAKKYHCVWTTTLTNAKALEGLVSESHYSQMVKGLKNLLEEDQEKLLNTLKN